MRSNVTYLEPELMDVVRLFPEAEFFEISHETQLCEGVFYNRVTVNGRVFETRNEDTYQNALEEKSLVKRYAKLALYRALEEMTGRHLPWGALTGIRPTRLAYGEREKGRDFLPLFAEMGVRKENAALVSRVIEGQEGIYEKREGNVDLYVSLPFCPSKCVYCSFITAPIGATKGYIPDYLTALEKELQAAKPLIKKLRSVYVGGGTPFALQTQELKRVLEAVKPLYEAGVEYTVEAGRPDVFTEEKLALCKEYGVSRICINAQSFSDRTLQAIGRKHTARQVFEAFEMAKPYGFTVNCDLIAGLTGESFEEFANSVQSAISLSPENITVHTLCLKKGAKLKEETARLGEENLAKMIEFSREALWKAGYEPYYLYRQKYMAGAHENVGWTKKGFASVYNIDVMEEIADNLAVGANAITKKIFVQEGRIERIGSPKDIPTYLSKVEKGIEEKRALFNGARS